MTHSPPLLTPDFVRAELELCFPLPFGANATLDKPARDAANARLMGLIRQGLDPATHCDLVNVSLLARATRDDGISLEVVEALLAAGALDAVRKATHRSPWVELEYTGSDSLQGPLGQKLEAWLAHGANINGMRDPSLRGIKELGVEDASLLHIKSFFGQVPWVEWLIDHGADPWLKDESGVCPMDLAAIDGGDQAETESAMLAAHARFQARSMNNDLPQAQSPTRGPRL
jgi:hypothetical protein